MRTKLTLIFGVFLVAAGLLLSAADAPDNGRHDGRGPQRGDARSHARL